MLQCVKRTRVIVSGRVQGVFFRASCAEEARRRGLTGWVRNTPDGRVEAVFEGLDADVDALVDWCRHGPRHAAVDALETIDEPLTGGNGFRAVG
jgi:acylphosphatase